MKLSFGEDVEAFRQEFIDWLAINRPTSEEMAADPSVSTGHSPGWMRAWTRRMFDAGWLVPGWGPELGGRNASAIETLVYLEELRMRGSPVPPTRRVSGSSRRRSSTTAPRNRSATSPCRCCWASAPPAWG